VEERKREKEKGEKGCEGGNMWGGGENRKQLSALDALPLLSAVLRSGHMRGVNRQGLGS